MGFFDDVVPSGDPGGRAEYEELRARRSDSGFDGPPREWVLPAALPWAVKLGAGPHACVALSGCGAGRTGSVWILCCFCAVLTPGSGCVPRRCTELASKTTISGTSTAAAGTLR